MATTVYIMDLNIYYQSLMYLEKNMKSIKKLNNIVLNMFANIILSRYKWMIILIVARMHKYTSFFNWTVIIKNI